MKTLDVPSLPPSRGDAPCGIVGITPFERPDARLVLALLRTGVDAVLDLGRDPRAAALAIAALDRAPRPFGVRIPTGVDFAAQDLPKLVDTVVVEAGAPVGAWGARRVLVQVTSLAEAKEAVASGAHGLIAKGSESGGRIGEETAFVLLQQLVAAFGAATAPGAIPIWVQGGIGVRTASACVVGGAAGVVIDSQLALVRESTLPEPVKTAVRSMDGSETVVVAGHRVYTRPGLMISRAEWRAGLDGDGVRARLGGGDVDRGLVPVGQDTAFARPLAERYRTAGGIVHAIRVAVAEHLAAATEHAPLAPDSALAKQHGVTYPIAQGPMTRVSDRAAFADAVSRAGGLPFLALSLLRGEEIRALLEETRALLGDRPFGVGILGFVPDDVRDEQLAVLRDLRPPAAIIAGGRPSRARPLEEQGTVTYLHVPSPGLLDLFLKDGARKFVFEGRECGGHVGPRTSFVLWEMQIERLLAHPEPSELSVLFAGGIHDARSSAMVAAMAAPLAARGAKIGVLMGTAYLFTEEAVASGAILPGFQSAAVACEKTVLLETAPGHATRCVESDYVRAFSAEKSRLESEGLGPEAVWAALEQLNLGRLRIAAKGTVRDANGLVQVNEETQAREGMFMIGQVAALRDGITTMAALHEEVSVGATALVSSRAVAEEPSRAPADVAIVGIACIFPDAPDRHAFWANIVAGKSSVTEVPKDRWDPEVYYDGASQSGEKTPSKWGGFIPAVAFDPLSYGIPPKSLAAIEPVQLLSLEVARRALADAGYADRAFDRERTSVIFGAEAGTELSSAYGFRAFWPQYAGKMPEALDAHLPTLTEDSFPGVLANVIAGRIANRLDLGGVNYTVDAACAASLAAVDLAVKELVSGTSDMVICGGADVHNSINDYLLFASVHALSPTGACRAFDASADGIALGEGVACVVLKRLADAERDGDRIYAVIKGVAGGSDGKSLGLTAPRKEGQIRALSRAYAAAAVSPASVGLVEAHGTGTVVGDRTELATLTDVYAAAGAEKGSVALGSVKSQIGHTKCAAGMAGLIKMALSIHHQVLPPTLHITKYNPGYDAATSPFTFGDVARPWAAKERNAAVSAFGFGGTNFHAVLSSYDAGDAPASGVTRWPHELFLFRGEHRDGAIAQMDRLEAFLDDPTLQLADLARSVSERRRRDDGPTQVAIVASSKEDLREKLAAARLWKRGPRGVFFPTQKALGGKTAFLFAGQGSQRTGMLADLFVAFPTLSRFLDAGARWAHTIFPPTAVTPDERAAQQKAITDTRVAQPALGIADLAAAELVRALGVEADMVAGHSYGELAALAFADAMSVEDLLALSEARGESILAAAGADPGTMAAAAASVEAVRAHLVGLDGVVVANVNAPLQTVISGPTAGVAEAVARLSAAGITAKSFPVACAFHSPGVSGASALLRTHLDAIELQAPSLPVYSNATATVYPADPAAIREKLAAHVALPVDFVAEVEAMYAAGARVFVEVGPARVLTALVGKILGDRPHVAVAVDQAGEPPLKQLLFTLAELATAGITIDTVPLFAGRDLQKIDLDTASPGKLAASTWMVDGHMARPLHGDLPKGAFRPAATPVVDVSAPMVMPAMPAPAYAPQSDREAAVLEYLRVTRDIVESQRQVLLGYLGEPIQPRVEPPMSLPGLPSFSPPPRSVAPPSIRPSLAAARAPSVSVAPAAKLPSESLEWMREIGTASGVPTQRSVPPAALAAAPAAKVDVKATLLRIVSERTGYPIDMLDLDLNLEAELSIDSIKRIEILATLGNEIGLTKDDKGQGDAHMEQLASRKTLRGILEWLEQNDKAGATNGAASKSGAAANAPAANGAAANGGAKNGSSHPPSNGKGNGNGHAHVAGATGPNGLHLPTQLVVPIPEPSRPDDGPRSAVRPHRALRRFVLRPVDAPLLPGSSVSLVGQKWAIVSDRIGIAQHVEAALAARGATVVPLGDNGSAGRFDGLCDLSAIAPEAPVLDAEKALFDRVLRSIAAGVRQIVAVTHAGAPFVAEHTRPRPGIAGLLKTVQKESGVSTRAVSVDPREPLRTVAEQIVEEIGSRDEHVEVTWASGVRRALAPTLVARARSHAEPALDRDSVVVATGGARGITATTVLALARRFGCKVELVGRSPLPEPDEDADLESARDAQSIRRVLIGRGLREPAQIEALVQKTIAAREIRATMKALADAGAHVGYQAVDVRDPRAFGAFIDDVYARHGRIDVVVHGAGLLEDKLLSDKTRDSFARVFDTKVASAKTLLDRLRPDVGHLVFFGSVSGAFGNKGQVDYASANDALDKLAAWQASRGQGKVVSIDWGPWAGGGMVSPELVREYERRGVGLIDPTEGAESFLGELLEGDDAQVILMNADPAAFIAQPRPSTPAIAILPDTAEVARVHEN